jgi:hypothetical protein
VAALFAWPLMRLLVDLSYGLLLLTCKAAAYAIGAVGIFCATLIHFSLSRQREFLADAGAVELTGNPDALISALRKVACNSEIATSIEGVREMLFESQFGGLFATHPPIERRIAALENYRRHREPPAPHVEPAFVPSADRAEPRPTAQSASTMDDARRGDSYVETQQSASATGPHPDRRAVDGFRRLLTAAMEGRPERTSPAQRGAVYERARAVLERQAENAAPAARNALQQALETAIREVERRRRDRAT